MAEIPGYGAFNIIADPTGTVLTLWQRKRKCSGQGRGSPISRPASFMESTMAEDRGFVEHVKDLLTVALGEIKVRPMFGGYGIYYGETMFALIAWGKLYFKADDQSKRNFEERGLKPFVYERRGKGPTVMSYWEVPPETLDEPDEIKPWAVLAIEAASRAKKSIPKKVRRKR